MSHYITDRFRRAVDVLIQKKEGGYVNHQKDRGGPTKFGISQRSYPHLDIKNLTREVAEDIYERDFWSPLRCDSFWGEELASMLFEFGVHAGIRVAARALQVALNGLGKPISADGRIGPATLAAANGIAEARLLEAYRAEILRHYRAIVRKNPSQGAFLKGWENRLAPAAAPARSEKAPAARAER